MENLLQSLLKNYMNDIDGVLATAVVDKDGLIITSETKEGTESETESIIGVLTALLDNYIDRIKSEFSTESNFFNITTTGDKKFAYCSMGPKTILTTIAEPSTPDIKIKVYSEHIAGKVELLLDESNTQDVSLEIPAIVKALSNIRGGIIPEGRFSTKIILVGDFQVGKTSLIRRFIQNAFDEDYISTIGVEISKKDVDISEKTKIQFIIWDVGGQNIHMAPYRHRFYQGANAAFIVIDRTRSDNLNSIEFWYNDIKKSVPDRIPIVIVGNKTDLIDQIEIKEEQIKEIAKKYNFHYIVTSAKTGFQVNDAFLLLAYSVLERYY